MAKKRKKTQSKYLHTAADLKKDERKKLVIFAVSTVVGVLIVAVYALLVSNALINIQGYPSLLIWLFFAILAAIVGTYGNRFTKAGNEYKRYLREHDIDNEEVKKFMQEHRL